MLIQESHILGMFYIVWKCNLLEIQFVIGGGFIYYLGRVYRAYREDEGGTMVEGDDWRIEYNAGLCDGSS